MFLRNRKVQVGLWMFLFVDFMVILANAAYNHHLTYAVGFGAITFFNGIMAGVRLQQLMDKRKRVK